MEAFKIALGKFLLDFATGAAAGAIAAFAAAGPDAMANYKVLAFIVVLGAFDGGISALRRYIQAAAK